MYATCFTLGLSDSKSKSQVKSGAKQTDLSSYMDGES